VCLCVCVCVCVCVYSHTAAVRRFVLGKEEESVFLCGCVHAGLVGWGKGGGVGGGGLCRCLWA
jgi:hypothetical protein